MCCQHLNWGYLIQFQKKQPARFQECDDICLIFLFSLSPGERGMGLDVNQYRRSRQVMCCCGQGLRCPVLRRVPHLSCEIPSRPKASVLPAARSVARDSPLRRDPGGWCGKKHYHVEKMGNFPEAPEFELFLECGVKLQWRERQHTP
jgi:hypothetical protein